MTKLTALAALALLVPSCVSASVTEQASATVDLGTYDIPAAPVAGIAVQLPPQTFSTVIDVSDVVSKLSDVAADVTIDVSQLVLHSPSDLSWLTQAVVTVGPQSGGTAAQLAHLVSVEGGNATFAIDMQQDRLLSALSVPATLAFTVSGTATTSTMDRQIEIDDTLSLVISAQGTKGI